MHKNKHPTASQSGHLRSARLTPRGTPARTAPSIRPVRPAHEPDSPAFRPLHSLPHPLLRLRGTLSLIPTAANWRDRQWIHRAHPKGWKVRSGGQSRTGGKCGPHPRRFAPRAARTFVTLRFELVALGRRDKQNDEMAARLRPARMHRNSRDTGQLSVAPQATLGNWPALLVAELVGPRLHRLASRPAVSDSLHPNPAVMPCLPAAGDLEQMRR